MTAWQKRAALATLTAAAVAVALVAASARDPFEPGVLVLFAAGASVTGWFGAVRPALLVVWFVSAGGALVAAGLYAPATAGDEAGRSAAFIGAGALAALAAGAARQGRGRDAGEPGPVAEPQTVAVLRAGERHYRRLAEAIPQILWSARADGRPDYCNRAHYDPLGLTADTVLTDDGVRRSVHPDDGPRYRAAWDAARRAGAAGVIECRLRVAGGHRWHACRFLPVRDAVGRLERWFCTGTDVEEQKRAEEARRALFERLEAAVEERTGELSRANAALSEEVGRREQAEAARTGLLRRIAAAQEEERSRIARELHDHLGQYLAAVGVGLRVVGESVPPDEGAAERLARLRELTEEMGREMHRLAVELRPAALDDLGLYAAVQNCVEEWARQTGVAADYHASGPDHDLPRPVQIAAYRVVQEALTNVLKHAAARRVGIVVRRAGGHLHVVIEDDGRGFDPDRAAAGRLGLLGMSERVAQVGGYLEINSEPGRGTAVVVRVPVGVGEER